MKRKLYKSWLFSLMTIAPILLSACNNSNNNKTDDLIKITDNQETDPKVAAADSPIMQYAKDNHSDYFKIPNSTSDDKNFHYVTNRSVNITITYTDAENAIKSLPSAWTILGKVSDKTDDYRYYAATSMRVMTAFLYYLYNNDEINKSIHSWVTFNPFNYVKKPTIENLTNKSNYSINSESQKYYPIDIDWNQKDVDNKKQNIPFYEAINLKVKNPFIDFATRKGDLTSYGDDSIGGNKKFAADFGVTIIDFQKTKSFLEENKDKQPQAFENTNQKLINKQFLDNLTKGNNLFDDVKFAKVSDDTSLSGYVSSYPQKNNNSNSVSVNLQLGKFNNLTSTQKEQENLRFSCYLMGKDECKKSEIIQKNFYKPMNNSTNSLPIGYFINNDADKNFVTKLWDATLINDVNKNVYYSPTQNYEVPNFNLGVGSSGTAYFNNNSEMAGIYYMVKTSQNNLSSNKLITQLLFDTKNIQFGEINILRSVGHYDVIGGADALPNTPKSDSTLCDAINAAVKEDNTNRVLDFCKAPQK